MVPDSVALWIAEPALRRQAGLEAARRDDFASYCHVVGYSPHAGQQEVHRSKKMVRVIDSGRRWGKTELAAYEGSFQILKGGPPVWIVANSHENKMRLWDRLTGILCDDLGFKPTKRSDNPQGICHLEFEWGGRCKGYSTQGSAANSIVGECVGLILWDEAAKSPSWVWERRMFPNLGGADYIGRAIITSTPEGYNHFHHLWQLGRGQDDDYQSWRFKSRDNPHLPQSIIDTAFRTSTPETFAQEWEGEFTTFAGRVYKEFREVDEPERLAHVRPLEYNPEWPLALAFDFGATNPFVCLWLQFTPSDHVHVLDEWTTAEIEGGKEVVRGNWDTVRCGQEVMQYHAEQGYERVDWCVGDPSGVDEIRTLRRHCGLPVGWRWLVPGGQKDREVSAGIERIQRLLREDRLVVDPRCTLTCFEFNRYTYPEKREQAEGNLKEKPFDANNHCMDSLRYGVVAWLARRPSAETQSSDDDEPEPVAATTDRVIARIDQRRRAAWRGRR